MKNRILQNISAVITALNKISVSGKDNLANLSGSICVLEDVCTALNVCEIIEPNANEEKEENDL